MPYESFKTRESLAHEHPWITAGGSALAVIAGYINVIVLQFFRVPVSHMSGAASRFGDTLVFGQYDDLKVVFWIIVSFFFGSVVSGFLISTPQLRPGRRYGVILIGEGIILGMAAFFLNREQKLCVPLAAMACGLQNAMASSYYGLSIRTTHVTGIVTDLGVIAGRRLRGHRVEFWKIVLLLSLFLGFIVGGIIAAFVLRYEKLPPLLLASAALITGGSCYSIWTHLTNKRPKN